MIHRLELMIKAFLPDPHGQKIMRQIASIWGWQAELIRIAEIYSLPAMNLSQTQIASVAQDTLVDPVLHELRINQFFGDEITFDWYIEIGFKPGVTDNVGRTAQETFELRLKQKFPSNAHIYSAKGVFLTAHLSRSQVELLTTQLLMNPLIESAQILSFAEWAEHKADLKRLPQVSLQEHILVERFQFKAVAQICQLSAERTWALSAEEAEAILFYYTQSATRQERITNGIGADPTDVELEILAQTWSEHCKHKIFNAEIDYHDLVNNTHQQIHSLYKTYVKGSTEAIRRSLGEQDWCVSVFTDNAGVICFNSDWNLVMKVETHNSPSALDPYGGALTGIVGVNRDSFGTGLGAELIFNTDVFCFASPFHDQPLHPKLMHPRRIFEGVRLGVEHGGNKSGIPTVNGSIVFHPRFLGKPLVFCGTGGLMPAKLQGKPAHLKQSLPGDAVVMCGGRIGKDGIHGATFSSEALHEGSPATAVQIGDPIVQKRMFDFLLLARDRGLYRCITDNGAGGLSSSVGEMAVSCNGADIELAQAPLKYQGLQPWEIFVSEAQERMTLAVPQEHLQEFLELSKKYAVESTVMGSFSASGYLNVRYQGEMVAHLDMKFLHEGAPQLHLSAQWSPPQLNEPAFPLPKDLNEILLTLLSSLNICSKESIVRQYDHEVQGGSVIKPFVGLCNDGPSDAAVIRPLLNSLEGVVVAHGICPKYSDLDTYAMMTCAIDEAVRGALCVGGTLEQLAGLDNFCWCDPIQTAKNPLGAYKLAQLVRANQALYDITIAYGVPCISGKDSMKNDYRHGDVHIAIPPTVLFSVVGKINDVRKCVTMDFKDQGDLIFLLGATKDECGGSEYYSLMGYLGKNVPQAHPQAVKGYYQKLTQSIEQGWVRSCHDCSDGGLAVALAESAFAGGLGADLDLTELSNLTALRSDKLLFSESQSRFLVTIAAAHRQFFTELFQAEPLYYLGAVNNTSRLHVNSNGMNILDCELHLMKSAWQKPLQEF